jgi:hypothetical protein
VARKPANFEWLGFNPDQLRLLDLLDHLGNNGWARNPQSDALMPGLLGECSDAGLSLDVVRRAMEDIGYGKNALHQLDRWESKRTTGKFGR